MNFLKIFVILNETARKNGKIKGVDMSKLCDQVNKVLKKMKKGDDSALEKLHNLTYNHLFGFTKPLLKNPIEIDEAVQVTYERAWQYIQSFDEEKDGYNWLCEIAKNICKSFNKKYQREQSLTDRELLLADPKSFYEADEWLENTEVRDAINQLEDVIDRNIVYYRYWKNFSLAQVSEKLKIPKTTVHDREKRARNFLLKKIKRKNFLKFPNETRKREI